MNKLVITKEQEEKLKEFEWHTTSKEDAFKLYKNKDPLYYGVTTFYSNFTPEQFALLLCGWYEVEESFKVGDWVTYNKFAEDNTDTSIITDVQQDNISVDVKSASGKNLKIFKVARGLRHATAEEIAQEKRCRIWTELGRGVNEWRENDIINNCGSVQTITSLQLNTSGCVFPFLDSKQSTIEHLNKYCWLVCPAEQRLDLN